MDFLFQILVKVFWERTIKSLWRHTLGYVINMFTYKKKFQELSASHKELSALYEKLKKNATSFRKHSSWLDVQDGEELLFLNGLISGSYLYKSDWSKEGTIRAFLKIKFSFSSENYELKEDFVIETFEDNIFLRMKMVLKKSIADWFFEQGRNRQHSLSIEKGSFLKAGNCTFEIEESNIALFFGSNWKRA